MRATRRSIATMTLRISLSFFAVSCQASQESRVDPGSLGPAIVVTPRESNTSSLGTFSSEWTSNIATTDVAADVIVESDFGIRYNTHDGIEPRREDYPSIWAFDRAGQSNHVIRMRIDRLLGPPSFKSTVVGLLMEQVILREPVSEESRHPTQDPVVAGDRAIVLGFAFPDEILPEDPWFHRVNYIRDLSQIINDTESKDYRPFMLMSIHKVDDAGVVTDLNGNKVSADEFRNLVTSIRDQTGKWAHQHGTWLP